MKLALFDIDGVLANDSHRVQFALEHNWGRYFDQRTVAQDTVHEDGWKLAREYGQNPEWTVGYLTGRGSSLRETTEEWLDSHEFPFGRILMRGWWTANQTGKRELLSEFKARKIRGLLLHPDIEDVVLFEDDPEVVRVIQEEFGPTRAVLIPWNTKPEALVKKATA